MRLPPCLKTFSAEFEFTDQELARLSPAALEALDVQRAVALCGLHKLAYEAESAGMQPVLIGWGRYLNEYLDVTSSSLPSGKLRRKTPEKRALLDVALCAMGGLAWGGLRGLFAVRRSGQLVWRSAALASLGSATFQALMEVSAEAHRRFDPWPTFGKLRNFTAAAALDLGLSCGLLFLILQPHRAPFAFGGWVLGQAAYVSALVLSDR